MSSRSLSSYPAEIASSLRKRWCEHGFTELVLPDCGMLEVILDCAYQASLLREEGDETQCRILIGSQSDLDGQLMVHHNSIDYVRFQSPVELTPHNIRKLARAAGFYRSLLLVDPAKLSEEAIWGIAVTGTDWVHHAGSGYTGRRPLPPNFVLQIRGPGNLVLSSGYERLLECSGGKILEDTFDPFRSSWLPAKFADVRVSIYEELKRDADPSIQTQLCDSFIKQAAQSVVRRALRMVRSQSHGGMLIYLPDDLAPQSEQWIRYRVRLKQDETTLRFRKLMLKLLGRSLLLAHEKGLPLVTWKDYLCMRDLELMELNRELMEYANVLADFMSIDGALVLTRSFDIVGFGGEIMGDTHVSSVECALDLDATTTRTEPADTSGTRHRSAYRLVNSIPDAIIIVVSQDGAVRFVAQQNGKITYWPYLP
jgi:hypothetical protein